MSTKSKKKQRPVSFNRAVRAALTMFLWAYCEIYDPDVADMENMSKEIQKVQEGVMTGRLRLSDIAQALKEERGWEIL